MKKVFLTLCVLIQLVLMPNIVFGQKVLLVVQIEYGESTFNEFPSAGWEAGVDVSVFNQKFDSDYGRKAPTDDDFRGKDGVMYIINYPLGSQGFNSNMAQLTMQTFHKIINFIESGGNAIILMNNEIALKNDEFKNYLRDKFSLIHNTQWTWAGITGSTVAKHPIDGKMIHDELDGLTLGGCAYPEIQGWYIPKPNLWQGEAVGNFTPSRYLSLRRNMGTGSIVFAVDCRYDSMFSDKYIGTFDNYKAVVKLLKWLGN